MNGPAILGERFPQKVGAVFDDGAQAREAADRVAAQAGIGAGQIRVVQPDDPGVGRKLKPETSGIARTLVKAHVTLGAIGLGIGLALAPVLVVTGFEAFSSNPVYTYLVMGFFGAIIGLLLGGLVTLRPDHERLIAWVKDAARGRQWFVLVHARDRGEERRARDALEKLSDRVIATS